MSDEIRFDGRVAVVTGAGAGLGKTYALELARRGAKVVVNDLGGARDGSGGSSSAADQVVEEIKSAGGEAAPNYDTVATPEGGENIIKTAVDHFGKVDIVVNNAGILRDKTFLKMEPESWDAVLNVHLRGSYCVTRAAMPILRENSYGRVVMTTSGAGMYGNFGQSNYAAAKMGLIGLMNVLKLEGAKYNILVNTIAPLAASRMTEDIMPPEFLKQIPPDFVTPMVVYLCSDRCTSSGNIYNAGTGVFSRAAIMTGPSIFIGDGKTPPTAEEVLARLGDIDSLEGAKPFGQLGEQVGDVMKAVTGQK